jgi:hypothetical protein
MSLSPHTDRLFGRICGIVDDRFADPDFGPGDLAAEAGISQRCQAPDQAASILRGFWASLR